LELYNNFEKMGFSMHGWILTCITTPFPKVDVKRKEKASEWSSRKS